MSIRSQAHRILRVRSFDQLLQEVYRMLVSRDATRQLEEIRPHIWETRPSVSSVTATETNLLGTRACALNLKRDSAVVVSQSVSLSLPAAPSVTWSSYVKVDGISFEDDKLHVTWGPAAGDQPESTFSHLMVLPLSAGVRIVEWFAKTSAGTATITTARSRLALIPLGLHEAAEFVYLKQ